MVSRFNASIFLFSVFLLHRFIGVSNHCYAQTKKEDVTPVQVSIKVLDSTTHQQTPVRVRLTSNSRVVKMLPRNAASVMYGVWDHADGYDFQPDSSFYVDGQFQLSLPEGEYSISLSKGMEYLDQHQVFSVVAGSPANFIFTMKRWIDMPSQGWFSADDHIHIRRSPSEDPLLMTWIQAEDIHIGVLLKMGDFWATYYDQYGWGEKGVYQDNNFLLAPGQEDPRTPELGHAIGLAASDKVRYPDSYYYYDKVFDRLHELEGVTAYAHHAETFHGYRGLMLDGLRHKVDALELLQYCVSEDPLQTRHYYHLLDLGYAVTAIAGSDFPWCGKDHQHGRPEKNARIGNARFYSFIDGALSFESWKKAVKKGHTFVTSGPMINLSVNGKLPGDTVCVQKGEKINITAEAFGHPTQVPLKSVSLIMHGKVIDSVLSDNTSTSASRLFITKEISAESGFWIAARADAGQGQAAHTTPVYVSVDDSGFHNSVTLLHYLDLAEKYLQELEREIQTVNDKPEFQSWRYRKGLEKRIADTRAVISQLRKKAR
jgi:hypothetical protein